MLLQRKFRVSETLTAGILLLTVLAPPSISQTVSDGEVDSKSLETLEEIVVRGQKPLLRLRVELYKSEDAFYDLFNSLNSDDEYDVYCRREMRTGSHITRRVCMANFERKLIAQATSRSLLGELYIHPVAEIEEKNKLMLEEMEALVAERPELLEALNELADAKRTLESEHRRRCEGVRLICE
jgi:hypothetical protein